MLLYPKMAAISAKLLNKLLQGFRCQKSHIRQFSKLRGKQSYYAYAVASGFTAATAFSLYQWYKFDKTSCVITVVNAKEVRFRVLLKYYVELYLQM